MHLFFGLRGALQMTDLFKMFMQTQMWVWERTNLKTGKIEKVQVQGALRECMGGIYEYVFPEECYDEVMTMLKIKDDNQTSLLGNFKPYVLRKALGNKVIKCPDFKEVKTNRYVERRGVLIYLIGVKYDKRQEVEEWGYDQEML